ncbi:MAG: hypothetical protein ACRC37_07805 [Lentisphaeria bacterium]
MKNCIRIILFFVGMSGFADQHAEEFFNKHLKEKACRATGDLYYLKNLNFVSCPKDHVASSALATLLMQQLHNEREIFAVESMLCQRLLNWAKAELTRRVGFAVYEQKEKQAFQASICAPIEELRNNFAKEIAVVELVFDNKSYVPSSGEKVVTLLDKYEKRGATLDILKSKLEAFLVSRQLNYTLELFGGYDEALLKVALKANRPVILEQEAGLSIVWGYATIKGEDYYFICNPAELEPISIKGRDDSSLRDKIHNCRDKDQKKNLKAYLGKYVRYDLSSSQEDVWAADGMQIVKSDVLLASFHKALIVSNFNADEYEKKFKSSAVQEGIVQMAKKLEPSGRGYQKFRIEALKLEYGLPLDEDE